MGSFAQNSTFLGAAISLGTYFLAVELRKRTRLSILNPLLVSIALTIAILLALRIDYETYYDSAQYVSYLLTPATIALAIPLYEQFEILKRNAFAVVAGIASGTLCSLLAILAMAILFELDHIEYITFLPKSITTAIGMTLSEEMGGYAAVTAVAIIITGVLGNVIADAVLRLFRITEPVAKGVALGTSAHAIGTSKALELGEVEGAMSSLSIVIAGLMTVAGMNLFVGLH